LVFFKKRAPGELVPAQNFKFVFLQVRDKVVKACREPGEVFTLKHVDKVLNGVAPVLRLAHDLPAVFVVSVQRLILDRFCVPARGPLNWRRTTRRPLIGTLLPFKGAAMAAIRNDSVMAIPHPSTITKRDNGDYGTYAQVDSIPTVSIIREAKQPQLR